MKQRLMNKAVTTQDGTDVGTVKNVIIDPNQKEITLEVSKGPLRGETKIPWTQIISVSDRIVLTDESSAGGYSTATTSNPQKSAQKQIGSIEVLYYSDCPHYEETLQTIRDLLSEEGLSADVRATDLSADTGAEKSRSPVSSPTVLLMKQTSPHRLTITTVHAVDIAASMSITVRCTLTLQRSSFALR